MQTTGSKGSFFLLDTPEDDFFEAVVELICTALTVPVALVTFIDHNRQFFKAARGLSAPYNTLRETPLSHSFCQHVVAMDHHLAVEDALSHPIVRNNPAITDFGVMAYLGYPLHDMSSQPVGAVCAVDVKWHRWQTRDHEVLNDLARMIDRHIAMLEGTLEPH